MERSRLDAPTLDELDVSLLMQKNIHFGGSFQEMLEYYQDVSLLEHRDDIDIDRVSYLKEVEDAGTDLEELLDEQTLEEIEDKKSLYSQIEDQAADSNNPEEQAIANLILCSEFDVEDEIITAANLGDDIVPYVLKIIERDDFYSKISPGQGRAPASAIRVLIALRDNSAILLLFSRMFNISTYTEGVFMQYFREFEAETKELIRRMLSGKTWSLDHERALSIATYLSFNQEIADECFAIIKDQSRCPKDEAYQTYLALVSNGDFDFPQNRKEDIIGLDHIEASVKNTINNMPL